MVLNKQKDLNPFRPLVKTSEEAAPEVSGAALTPRDTSKLGWAELTDAEKATKMDATGKSGAMIESEEIGNLGTPEVFRDEDTGKLSGFTDTTGKTILSNQNEVRALANVALDKATNPAGTQAAGTQATAQADMRRKLNMASAVGQIDLVTAQQAEEQGLNVEEFLRAGLGKAGETAVTFGVTAGVAGSIGGVGVATGIGGTAVGAITGFFKGVTDNIKTQRKDLVNVKTKELKQRKTAVNNYISAANANPAAAEEYVQAMNIELSLIRRDYNTLVQDGDANLVFWGSDATPQLVEYEVFFESTEPSLLIRMEQAVLKPDPTRAYTSTESSE